MDGKPRHFSRRQKESSHLFSLVFRAGKNGGVRVRSGFGSISLFFSSWFSGGENGTFFRSWREKKEKEIKVRVLLSLFGCCSFRVWKRKDGQFYEMQLNFLSSSLF